jgi:hypothetical protein
MVMAQEAILTLASTTRSWTIYVCRIMDLRVVAHEISSGREIFDGFLVLSKAEWMYTIDSWPRRPSLRLVATFRESRQRPNKELYWEDVVRAMPTVSLVGSLAPSLLDRDWEDEGPRRRAVGEPAGLRESP